MRYIQWYHSFGDKHKKIVEKLTNLSDDKIIDYFDYENMKIKESDFCPLYKKNKKCHDIEDLNCYFCGCPYFRVGKKQSICSIDAKDGSSIIGKDGYIHQNCSYCIIPHKKQFIKNNFQKNWKQIMEKTIGDI